MSSELFDAIQYLEKEKGINKEVLMEALEAALISAYKKNFKSATNVRVDINEQTGSMHVFSRKEIVEEVEDSQQQIDWEEAKQINPNYEIGDVIELEVTPRDFGRIAAQAAKQVVTQRVREAERGVIFNEYIDREEDIMNGIIQRVDPRFVYVNLGKVEAKLPEGEKMPTEVYNVHDRIKVFVTKVENTNKGPQIFVSRSHPGLLKRLFEIEVPEIYEGIVEIRSVAREAGDRSKISVHAPNPEIDPVGSCVGQRGQRVQTIVDELKGEKIDIVEWSDDPVVYVSNALSPSKVVKVLVNEEEQATTVIVPDNQLSLAIGKRGQNARLAARLTGWKIDIKSESEAKKVGLLAEEKEVNDQLEEPLFDTGEDLFD
ncbi:transcription termination factor NusA [Paraliobacillus sp. JSM ZJ581]|uniref:transcription termination factor NusA n=1 Tax=Paraliobacillus sp. JSM ZJ581 TaxID=3342118 RepID=UPI0035A879FD